MSTFKSEQNGAIIVPDLSELLKNLPIDSIASQLGVDKAQATQAVEMALPALISGLNANAQDSAGAQSLSKALSGHSGVDVSKLDAKSVDTKDGEKIVQNIFGNNTDKVVSALDGKAAAGGIANLIPKVLPLLAPMVMAYLANQFGGNSNKSSNDDDGGLLGMLGGLLGGGGNNNSSSGGGLLDMVGGLFGGGNNSGSNSSSTKKTTKKTSQSSGNAGGGDLLGDLLGGLLGGGKR